MRRHGVWVLSLVVPVVDCNEIMLGNIPHWNGRSCKWCSWWVGSWSFMSWQQVWLYQNGYWLRTVHFRGDFWFCCSKRNGRMSWAPNSRFGRPWDSNPWIRILVESSQWRKDWYLSLLGQSAGIMRIWQGLVGSVLRISWPDIPWCWLPGTQVGQHIKIVMSVHCHMIWPKVLLRSKTPTTNLYSFPLGHSDYQHYDTIFHKVTLSWH